MSCESIKNGLDKFANAGLRPLPRAPRERDGNGQGYVGTTVFIRATLLGSSIVVTETPSGIRATVNGNPVERGIPAKKIFNPANLHR